MSRCVLALCSVLVAITPQAPSSSPTIPPGFERSDVYRHSINAVIGDLSFVVAYGTLPPVGTDPDLRVRTHLEFVHAVLSARDTSQMPAHLREARERHLGELASYIDAGVFPRNHRFRYENRPCFIDREGRICAVGYLVQQSAGRDVAEAINAGFQDEFLWKMDLAELDRWAAESGLSVLELSMIQPQYLPSFHISISQDAQHAPATVTITGYVRDEGCCCGISSLRFELGDDAVWVSPLSEGYYHPVDFEWTYRNNGIYTITGKAIAPDWCGSLVGVRMWTIVVGPHSLALAASASQNGPPYEVHLETPDDVRPDQFVSATVDWGDGGGLESAGWYQDGEIYRTPAHAYSEEGQRMVTASIAYASGPAITGSTTVDVGHTLATESTTWGRIKALYR